MDRVAMNRALAKAIAFKQCGKDGDAEEWAITLVELLGCADILSPGRSNQTKAKWYNA